VFELLLKLSWWFLVVQLLGLLWAVKVDQQLAGLAAELQVLPVAKEVQ
jgi:hypothetical protein